MNCNLRDESSRRRSSGASRPPSRTIPLGVSDLRRCRRLEMMNSSKSCGPSGGSRALSPKRRRPGLRVPCSPSPRPSPRGEGETFGRSWIIRPNLVIVCLRDKRQRSGNYKRNVGIFQRSANALSLLGEKLRVPCPPSPRPRFGETTKLGFCVPPKRWTKRRGLQAQHQNFPARCQRSPSPRGEGCGEGEGSDLQPRRTATSGTVRLRASAGRAGGFPI